MLEREREKWELHRGRWQGPSHRQCFSGHWRISYFYFNLVEMGNKTFWSRDWHEQKDCSGHRVELNWVSWRQKAVLHAGYGRELSAVNSTPDPRPSPQALMTDGNDVLHPPVPTGFQFRWYWWEALMQEEQSGRDTLCFSSTSAERRFIFASRQAPASQPHQQGRLLSPKAFRLSWNFKWSRFL